MERFWVESFRDAYIIRDHKRILDPINVRVGPDADFICEALNAKAHVKEIVKAIRSVA